MDSVAGFSVYRDFYPAALIEQVCRRYSLAWMRHQPDSARGDSGLFAHLDFNDVPSVELLLLPIEHGFLGEAPRLRSCYITAKPPRSASLAWHHDLFYEWNRVDAPELFMLTYLSDTTESNGALRVIPGSQHQVRSAELPTFDEAKAQTIAMETGDLFVADRRILHATWPNDSEDWRIGITTAWLPNPASLPADVLKNAASNVSLPHREDPSLPSRLRALLPDP